MNEIRINFLEHLTYIIEAVAQGIVSEAKYELGKLIHRIESGDLTGLEERSTAISKLKQAEKILIGKIGRPAAAASCLAGISRMVWKDVFNRR